MNENISMDDDQNLAAGDINCILWFLSCRGGWKHWVFWGFDVMLGRNRRHLLLLDQWSSWQLGVSDQVGSREYNVRFTVGTGWRRFWQTAGGRGKLIGRDRCCKADSPPGRARGSRSWKPTWLATVSLSSLIIWSLCQSSLPHNHHRWKADLVPERTGQAACRVISSPSPFW